MFKYLKNNVKQLNISCHKMKQMISAGNVQISLVRETNHRKLHTLPTEHGSSWTDICGCTAYQDKQQPCAPVQRTPNKYHLGHCQAATFSAEYNE